jgi:hypothetical protein
LPLLAPSVATALASMRSPIGRATAALGIAFGVLIAAIGVAFPDRLFLLSDPHGIARFLEATQGSAPLAAALPTFTQEDWTAPLVRAVPWIVAAVAALGAAWVVAHEWLVGTRVRGRALCGSPRSRPSCSWSSAACCRRRQRPRCATTSRCAAGLA